MRGRGGFARRFIAGETVEEAIDAARADQANGLHVTLDYLGESVASIAEADAATRAYIARHRADRRRGHRAQHLAEADAARPDVDRATCVDNLRRILDAAATHGILRPRSTWRTPRTPPSRSTSSRRCGSRAIATSASCCSRTCRAARRTRARMNALGARVRLVKGAYKEPRDVAYQSKADVDAAFVAHHELAARGGHVSRRSRRTIRR